MGKKSKAKQGAAAAKARAKGAGLAAASVAAVTGAANGGAVGIKKLKCVRCLALLKDLTKAHACPGCSLLYCWRCEKKAFGECPNGEACAHPIRRCFNCATGVTVVSALEEAGRWDDTVMQKLDNCAIELTDTEKFGEVIDEFIGEKRA